MAITMEKLRRKAEAYDEVLERAKEIVNNQNASLIWKDWLRNTFPELKESEGERIRKGIIDFLWKEKIFLQEAHSSVENNPKYRFVMDAIAWLEKQGERKPAWSEEDDNMLTDAIGEVGAADYYTFDDKKLKIGLNQLKKK